MTEPAPFSREHYLNANFGWRSWLLTTDHKRVALLYLISITSSSLSVGLRHHHPLLKSLTPQGDLVGAETYNKLFSMHGIIMVFFF